MIEFKVVDIGVTCFAVKEPLPGVSDAREWRHVATFGPMAPLGAGAQQRAVVYAAHLTAEHAGGRKPQSFCGPTYAPRAKSDEPRVMIHPQEPCDFERINDPRLMTDVHWASVVLCARHSEVRP